MKRIVFWGVLGLLILGLGAFGWAFTQVGNQGLMVEEYGSYKGAEVSFDSRGIPTITGDTWINVIQAQGFVVASERLFQMDLIRRKAGGRLAEWFGEAAFEHDVTKQKEDRLAVVARAYGDLPAREREVCDAYAAGVNQFVSEYPGRWGVEYLILGVSPEPWKCEDSLLVLIEMAETLTSSSGREARSGRWRDFLPPDWWEFIFTQNHPWNRPYFGPRVPRYPRIPNSENFLPMQPIGEEDAPKVEAASLFERVPAIGSNNWAYRGNKGAFLANDPHLGQNVPTIWYAARMKISPQEWVVGATLPGLPGVILGMNRHVSWAFTNTGEDVDDYLLEELSNDGRQYVASVDPMGNKVWQPVIEREFQILVKGEESPRKVVGKFTHRGPMAERKHLEGMYSRQWAPLKPGVIRLPIETVMNSRSIEDSLVAIDGMRTPAQNVLLMDREGRMAYRVSGVGVRRRVSGRWPRDAVEGEWIDIAPIDERRSMVVDPEDGEHRYLATANERIWIDGFGHSWFGEDRKERILRFLSASPDLGMEDMTDLHNDTESRFRREFLAWIANTADADDIGTQALKDAWLKWDGTSRSDPLIFHQSSVAEDRLLELLLSRLRRQYGQNAPEDLRFSPNMERAWLMSLMAMDRGFQVFGLDDAELANHLMAHVGAQQLAPQNEENRWKSQHPFVANVPVIGSLFEVLEIQQWGSWDVVNAESPRFGPSMRLVWNMTDPKSSTWAFPVGQSGHIRSLHYRDLQSAWEAGRPYKVFPDTTGFEF